MGGRFHNLDFFRSVSALIVAGLHFAPHTAFAGGYIAVDFFFVLSGFVLTYSSRGRSVSFRGFLLRRLVRLYPLALASMLLYVGLVALLGDVVLSAVTGDPNKIWLTFSSLLLLSGLGFAKEPPFNFVTWSVSVELLASFVVFLRLRYGSRALDLAILAVAMLLYARLFQTVGHLDVTIDYDAGIGISFGLERGLGGIILGTYLFDIFNFRLLAPKSEASAWRPSILATVAELAIIWWLATMIFTHAHTRADFAVVIVLCAFLLLIASQRGLVGHLLNTPLCGRFGEMSYSLYLVQLPLLLAFNNVYFAQYAYPFATLSTHVQLAILLLTLVPIGYATHRIVEKPLGRYGARWLASVGAR